jgi:hypothetical protein
MSTVKQARKAEKDRQKSKLKKLRAEQAAERLRKLLEECDYDQMKRDLERLCQVKFLDPSQKKRKARLQEDIEKIEEYRKEKEESEKALAEAEAEDDEDSEEEVEPEKVSIPLTSAWATVLAAKPVTPPPGPTASFERRPNDAAGALPGAYSAPPGPTATSAASNLVPLAVLRRRAQAAKRAREEDDPAPASTSMAYQGGALLGQVQAPPKKDVTAKDMEALLESLAEEGVL